MKWERVDGETRGEKRACGTFRGQGTRKREMKFKYRIYPIKKKVEKNTFKAPLRKPNMASVIVSEYGAHSWDGSQIVPVTEWPFLQSRLHFCPCISFKQE